MDLKLNKITYQKSRLGVLCLFILINFSYELVSSALFGPSDFYLTSKIEKSMGIFFALVALIIFRQKYELQIASKYRQDNLHFGKVINLPAIFICCQLSYLYYYNKAKLMLVHFIFLVSFTVFFFEKACRTLGINSLLQLRTEEGKQMPSLFTESGGINFDTLRMYFVACSNLLNFGSFKNTLFYDVVRVTWSNPESKRILIFFTINIAFFFIELVYGYLSNSLGLISDAFHMLFDCMALLIGLMASYVAQLKFK